jgi:hypothetical protein
MKKAAVLAAIVLVIGGAGVTVAQQPAPQPAPMPGHHQMQGGMCPMMGMMGGGMGSGMMGMMGTGQAEPPRVVQMRGEMMKAMGEVMMKYGKMMEGATK